jgi:cytochrome c1
MKNRFVIIMLLSGVVLFASQNIDKESGLKIAKGYKTVKQHCMVCHSAKFIIHQRGTRDIWLEMIKWMQKTQGLWDLGKDEAIILDYLEKNYAPDDKEVRRKNLPENMLPKAIKP